MPLCLIPLKLFFFFIGYVIFWLYGYLVVTNYMASLKVFALNYLLEESVLWIALPFPVHLTIPFPLFISSFFKQLFSIPFHLKSIIKHVHDSFLSAHLHGYYNWKPYIQRFNCSISIWKWAWFYVSLFTLL